MLSKSKVIIISIVLAVFYTAFWVGFTLFIADGNPTLADASNTSKYISVSGTSSASSLTSDIGTSSFEASSDGSSAYTSSEVNSGIPNDDNTGEGNNNSVNTPIIKDDDFTVGMWFSMFELNFSGLNEAEFKKTINTMFDNAVGVKVTDVYCHVRPLADAYYRSELFPMSQYVSGTQGVDPGYDPLEYMVTAAHQRGLKIHAWINPYRVSKTDDLSTLSDTNIAKIWLTDDDPSNDRNIIVHTNTNGGKQFYFNPAKTEVRKLIIDGVREILENYDVDGIQIDDYFYPESGTFDDSNEYNEYVQAESNAAPFSLGDWRRANVTALVSGIYSAVHCYDNVVFGISPSAHISDDKTDKNYTLKYADIALWMSTKGYCDYIAPQLYFGYEYPLDEFKYNNLLKQWTAMKQHDELKMYIGIAVYKIDKSQATNSDGTEWQNNTNIVAKQVIDAANADCDGVALYSYSYICTYKGAVEHKNALIDALNSLTNRG